MNYNNLSIDELYRLLKNVDGAFCNCDAVFEVNLFGVDIEIKDKKLIENILDNVGRKIYLDLMDYKESVRFF
jgi:hypothetical protein